MIEGIHCDVSVAEMREHLEERIRHHQEKAAFYARSATELERNGLAESQGSRNPLGDIRGKATEHLRAIGFLTFVRDHLVDGETYRLSEHDMQRLGFVEWVGY